MAYRSSVRTWLALCVCACWLSCSRGCRTDTPEGFCLTRKIAGTSDAGHAFVLEACGELVLSVEWDIDSDGEFNCRQTQFVASEGTFVRRGARWVVAPADSGCPPE